MLPPITTNNDHHLKLLGFTSPHYKGCREGGQRKVGTAVLAWDGRGLQQPGRSVASAIDPALPTVDVDAIAEHR
jgi:hypothetical protein